MWAVSKVLALGVAMASAVVAVPASAAGSPAPVSQPSAKPSTSSGTASAPTPTAPRSVLDYPGAPKPTMLTSPGTPPPVPTLAGLLGGNNGQNGPGVGPGRWNGGPVQHHPGIYMLYWGPNWVNNGPPISASMGLFQHTSHDGWTNILAQYNDSVDQIHPDAYLAGSWQTNDGTPCIDPNNLEQEIEHASSVRGWAYSADSQFIVWPQQGACINWAAFGKTTNSACGWHGLTPTISQVYSLVPYAGDDGCQGGYTMAQVMTGITSHEYVESASDPDVGTGWTDQTGQYELGDMCQGWPFFPGPNGEYVAEVYAGNGCMTSFAITYDWAFIAQHNWGNSFPYMSPEHSYPWWVQIKNKSNVPWGVGPGGTVRLGTTNPQDRSSVFDNGSWLSPNRIALTTNVTTNGTTPVLPGQIGEFDFTFTPPAGLAPGNYTENFTPVADGYTWMNGGIYWPLTVGSYAGGWVSQTGAPNNLYLAGSTMTVTVTFSNTGNCPWFGGDGVVVLSTSHPTYRSSTFQAATWVNYYTPVGMANIEVDPGSTYTFQFQLSIPLTQTPGNYSEYFDLNANGTGYFTNSGYYVPITVV